MPNKIGFISLSPIRPVMHVPELITLPLFLSPCRQWTSTTDVGANTQDTAAPIHGRPDRLHVHVGYYQAKPHSDILSVTEFRSEPCLFSFFMHARSSIGQGADYLISVISVYHGLLGRWIIRQARWRPIICNNFPVIWPLHV
jgi:hypothetical protein